MDPRRPPQRRQLKFNPLPLFNYQRPPVTRALVTPPAHLRRAARLAARIANKLLTTDPEQWADLVQVGQDNARRNERRKRTPQSRAVLLGWDVVADCINAYGPQAVQATLFHVAAVRAYAAHLEKGRITVYHVADDACNDDAKIRWTCHNCGNPRELMHVQRPTAESRTDLHWHAVFSPCEKTPGGKTPDADCRFGQADLTKPLANAA